MRRARWRYFTCVATSPACAMRLSSATAFGSRPIFSSVSCRSSGGSSSSMSSVVISFLKGKEKELLQFLIKSYREEFTPIEVSRELSVTNKTIINRLAVLVKNGFVVPILVNKRIRSYELSKFTRNHEKEIMKVIS